MAQRIQADLGAGRCVSVTGLSNSGKSTLMRALGSPEALPAIEERAQGPCALVYLDCNQAVALSPQAFYELVLRALLEKIAGAAAPDLQQALRQHHQTVTDADSAFPASLSFNLALTELCEGFERSIVLLIDEFDEIFASLDERALLNLRALRDRFARRLTYATATMRSLSELRSGTAEDEFSEMFASTTYTVPPLTSDEMVRYLAGLPSRPPDLAGREVCLRLSGGHPGILVALAQALAAHPEPAGRDLAEAAGLEPGPRAECLKIWAQLRPQEQADLVAMATQTDADVAAPQSRRLETLGLARQGKLFSPLFADFVARRGRAAEVGGEGVHLDPDSGDVWVDGMRIPVLTELEFRLLQLLYDRIDKLTDKYRIVTAVWGDSYLDEVDDTRVEKLVSRLRGRIEPDPAAPRYLVTVRGRGYKLLSRPQEA
ncbi:MAG TPA: winged helix-turn-helix domain-containing protein [Anaerolineales bacterium]|nr:winged helix-turn-helix domain-containing protein [Anaerolineales bacterium]